MAVGLFVVAQKSDQKLVQSIRQQRRLQHDNPRDRSESSNWPRSGPPGKAQVKALKTYLRDSGLLHQLLGIRVEKELLAHPKSGASWEGYAIEETLKAMQPDEAYFWATHQGAELDLLLIKGAPAWGGD